MATSFSEYAYYCYKTNNSSALFSNLFSTTINSICIEGLAKLMGHLCVEYGKYFGKLGCLRKKRQYAANKKFNKPLKPAWMSSSLGVKF